MSDQDNYTAARVILPNDPLRAMESLHVKLGQLEIGAVFFQVAANVLMEAIDDGEELSLRQTFERSRDILGLSIDERDLLFFLCGRVFCWVDTSVEGGAGQSRDDLSRWLDFLSL